LGNGEKSQTNLQEGERSQANPKEGEKSQVTPKEEFAVRPSEKIYTKYEIIAHNREQEQGVTFE